MKTRPEKPIPWIGSAVVALTLFLISTPDVRAGGATTSASLELIGFGSTWRYQDDGSNLYPADDDPFGGGGGGVETPFYSEAFNDSGWATGVGRFGYGGDGEVTTVSFGPNSGSKFITTYFRRTFDYDPGAALAFDRGVINLYLDDGAVVFLNGVELRRVNMPGGRVTGSTRASSAAGGADEITPAEYEFDKSLLRDGENLLAVAVHQASSSSSDLGFDLRLAVARDVFFSALEISDIFREMEKLAVTDVNLDGLPDVVYTRDSQTDEIRYRLNLGNFLLGPPVVIDEFSSANFVLASDLDKDGREDIIAARTGGGVNRTLGVYRNTPAGFVRTLELANYEHGDIILADLDGDGFDELITGFREGTVHALKGDGAAGFDSPVAIDVSNRINGLDSGDFDLDGDIDIAVETIVDGRTIFWIENQGTGQWATRHAVDSGPGIGGFVAGDLDNDGDSDLVVEGSSTRVYENDGSGSFTRGPGVYDDNGFISLMQLADLDGDNDLDFFGHIMDPNNSVQWFENDGDGNFAAGRFLEDAGSTLVNPEDLTTADFDNDGARDIVMVDFSRGELKLFRSQLNSQPRIVDFEADDNTLTQGETATLSWDVEGGSRVLLDGVEVTGNSAVVEAGDSDTVFTLTVSNGAGTVTRTLTIFVPEPLFSAEEVVAEEPFDSILKLATGDLDGDGTTDIVFASRDTDEFGWLANLGDQNFSEPRYLARDLDQVTGPLVADLDKDGDLDLVAASARDNLVWFRNEGGGEFSDAINIGDVPGWLVKAIDINGDDNLDLVVQFAGVGIGRVVLGDGAGNFGPIIDLEIARGRDFEVADFTGDGILDLLWLGEITMSLLPGDGAGPASFPFDNRITVAERMRSARSIEVADFDGDGFLDIVIAQQSGNRIRYLRGLGLGQFEEQPALAEIQDITNSTSGDYDGDGDIDIAIITRGDFNSDTNFVYWFESDGAGNFSEPQLVTDTIFQGTPIHTADLDRDGDLDLLMAGDTTRIAWMRNNSQAVAAPEVVAFRATPPEIGIGGTAELSWIATGLPTVSIEPGIGEINGDSVLVSPAETTTYTLTATNAQGAAVATTTVTVKVDPKIQRFSTSQEVIDRGTEIELSWEADNADQFFISPGIGEVTGNSTRIAVDRSTVFTLVSTNASGSDRTQVIVRVNPAVCGFIKQEESETQRQNHAGMTFLDDLWYIHQSLTNNYWVYDANFNLIRGIQLPTLSDIRAMTHDPDTETLYISNPDNNMIHEIEVDGAIVRSFPWQTRELIDFVYDPTDRTFWMCYGDGRVTQNDREGGLLRTIRPDPDLQWSSIALTGEGTLLLLEFDDDLYEYDLADETLEMILDDQTTGNAFNGNSIGMFFFQDSGELYIGSQTEKVTRFIDHSRGINSDDETPPQITGAKDIVVNSAAGGSAAVSFASIFAYDEVDGEVAVSFSRSDESPFPVGATEVTVSAEDCRGNVASDTFRVIVLTVSNAATRRVLDIAAVRGDPTPGAGDLDGVEPGRLMHHFNRAVINDAGDLLMEAVLEDLGTEYVTGLFTNTSGSWRSVAFGIGRAPANDEFGYFRYLALNDAGETGFETELGSGDSHYLGDRAVARAGFEAPGTGGAEFGVLHRASLDPSGDLITPANLAIGTGAPETDVFSDTGIWTSDHGLLVREGATSPIDGLPYGHIYPRAVASGDGGIAFASNVGDSGAAVFLRAPADTHVVVRRGDPAPGTETVFDGFSAESANAGKIVFRATLRLGNGIGTGNNEGLWANRAGFLEPIVREGSEAPCLGGGVPAQFDRFSDMFISDDGTICFLAWLKGPGVNSSNDGSIWRIPADGQLHLVAREGDPANNTSGNYGGIVGMSCNDPGGIVFAAQLVEGDGHPQMAVWLDRGADATPQLVLRHGDLFDVSETERAEVLEIRFERHANPFGGTGGYGRILNDSGQVVLGLSLSGNSSGVFVIDPTPGPPAATARSRRDSRAENPVDRSGPTTDPDLSRERETSPGPATEHRPRSSERKPSAIPRAIPVTPERRERLEQRSERRAVPELDEVPRALRISAERAAAVTRPVGPQIPRAVPVETYETYRQAR